ncbi:hypothetical protein LTR56_006164 [Elasticomyces elasticus]|nr:hypothetical protein LTR56_006164 [Elasticomyces elasticus]KAK3667566.1 hypothetical protein LTR22_001381 [Elasticomyces elasticus]KAK4928477.1 hypothetical protein LTR49_004884 [Elasticomyces elasticus]KAK5753585.1 hypothetical protein LTS12_016321 [Elasticomyces elasticus]
MTSPLTNLINTYHELNASEVDELEEEPSALEFLQFVAKNRPFVVRHAANSWTASEKWVADYLRQKMGSDKVKVAITPLGNADAVVQHSHGSLVFVEPHEIFEPFTDFLDDTQASSSRHVKYAQTQNDNLRNEYANLLPDVPTDIPFARLALGQSADAINLWLGDDRSVTSLHKDNYENIYVQIRGQKDFVLMPPVEMPCVNEQLLQTGRYVSADDGELIVRLDEEAERIPVATWDPDEPEQRTTPYSHLAKPLRVTLREGDLLYLPSMWYHKVSQRIGDEGFVCAVNYWYDMDFAGNHWAQTTFIRDVYQAEQMKPVYPKLETGDEKVTATNVV